MFIESAHVLAIPSTLAPFPVMLGDTRCPRGFRVSLMAVLSAGVLAGPAGDQLLTGQRIDGTLPVAEVIRACAREG